MADGPHQTTPPPPPPTGAPQGPAAPPPAGQTPKKKGLHPLAWVGIGCGAIILLALIAFVVLGGWLFDKAKDAAEEFEADPAMASAKMVVRMSPELELLEADEEAGTLTIRNKETGEESTVGLEEVEQGRITFSSGDEKVTMGMEEDEEGGGAFTVRDEEGKARFRVGSGGDEELPGWIPAYPGAEPEGTYLSSTEQQTEGGFTYTIGDDLDEVLAFYEDALESEGFEFTGRNSWEGGGTRGASLAAEQDGRSVQVMIMEEAESQVTVTFSDEAE